MILGRVTGTVVSTIKDPVFEGRKLLLVEKISPEGDALEGYLVAVDMVDAGLGDTVLLIDEGNSARQVVGRDPAPIRAVVVGVVDSVDLDS